MFFFFVGRSKELESKFFLLMFFSFRNLVVERCLVPKNQGFHIFPQPLSAFKCSRVPQPWCFAKPWSPFFPPWPWPPCFISEWPSATRRWTTMSWTPVRMAVRRTIVLLWSQKMLDHATISKILLCVQNARRFVFGNPILEDDGRKTTCEKRQVKRKVSGWSALQRKRVFESRVEIKSDTDDIEHNFFTIFKPELTVHCHPIFVSHFKLFFIICIFNSNPNKICL